MIDKKFSIFTLNSLYNNNFRVKVGTHCKENIPIVNKNTKFSFIKLVLLSILYLF